MLALGEEATDEEVAAVQEDSALALADLDDEQWRAILVTKSEALVLDMAEEHPEALPVLLASILERSGRTPSGKGRSGIGLIARSATGTSTHRTRPLRDENSPTRTHANPVCISAPFGHQAQAEKAATFPTW